MMDNKFPKKAYQQPLTNTSPLVNPLSIILVKNGSKGDRLLFRYPFNQQDINIVPERLTPNPNLKHGFDNLASDNVATIHLQITPASGSGPFQKMSRYPSTSSASSYRQHQQTPSTVSMTKSSLLPTKKPKTPNPAVTSGSASVPSGKSVRISSNVDEAQTIDENVQVVPEKENPMITSAGSTTSTNTTPNASANTSTSSLQSLATPLNKSTPIVGTTTNTLLPPLGTIHSSATSSAKQASMLRDRSLLFNPNASPNTGDILSQLSDKDLSNLLSVSSELAEKKFELKINQVRFVGHPTLMQHPNMNEYYFQTPNQQASTIKIFHIVFCVKAMASHSIVKCFYDLSKRLGIGLRHEEYRCNYLSTEIKKIVSLLDDASHHHEISSLGCGGVDHDNIMEDNYFEQLASEILEKSSLAQLMKKVYDDICQTGFVKLKINHWVQISFCLPQKVHVLPYRDPQPIVEPEHIHKCLEAIRPYHAILLLVDREELMGSFGIDSTPTIPRFLQVYSPLKSLQVAAADSDLTLSHVVEIASHLVYWSMATIVYPICETNVYVIAPDAPFTSTELDDAFLDRFPGLSLSQTLSDFSVPSQLGELINPVLGGSYVQSQVIQLVCWLLQNHLLMQLHTYIYLVTYLEHAMDPNFTCDNDNGFNNLCPPYFEHDEEDDITVSDSYSETTGDDFLSSPIPPSTSTLSQILSSESGFLTATNVVGSPSNGDDVISHYNMPGGENDERNEILRSSTPCPEKMISVPVPMEKIKGTMDELSDPVRRALNLVKQPITVNDIKTFSRLSKYFNGEFHVEEIMYMENMRRSQLLLLMDKFRDVLVTVEKEDDDINLFKKQ